MKYIIIKRISKRGRLLGYAVAYEDGGVYVIPGHHANYRTHFDAQTRINEITGR